MKTSIEWWKETKEDAAKYAKGRNALGLTL